MTDETRIALGVMVGMVLAAGPMFAVSSTGDFFLTIAAGIAYLAASAFCVVSLCDSIYGEA